MTQEAETMEIRGKIAENERVVFLAGDQEIPAKIFTRNNEKGQIRGIAFLNPDDERKSKRGMGVEFWCDRDGRNGVFRELPVARPAYPTEGE